MSTKKEIYSKSTNLLRLFLCLKKNKAGVPVKELCNEFFGESSVRTIQRFVKAIKESITDDEGQHIFLIVDTDSEDGTKKITLNPKYLTGDKVEFEEQQIFSVMLADCLMANIKKCSEDLKTDLRGLTDIKTDLINFLVKKSASKAEYNSEDDFDDSKFFKETNPSNILKTLKSKFYSKKMGYKIYAEDEAATKVLDTVTDALYQCKKVRITYKSRHATEIKEHIIRPYTLLEHGGVYYIMGTFDNSRKPALFSIDRIKSARKLKETFVIPKDYDPAQVVERGVGVGDYDRNDKAVRVELLFRKEVAYLIRERFWHITQEKEELKDGSIKLSMFVPLSFELNKLIFSFGSMVKVLAPKELALEIKKDRAVLLYEDVLEEKVNSEKNLYLMVTPKERKSEKWISNWDTKGVKLLSMETKKEIADECMLAKKNKKPVFIHRTSHSTDEYEAPPLVCCSAHVDSIKELKNAKYEIVFRDHKILNTEPPHNYKKLNKGSYYFL